MKLDIERIKKEAEEDYEEAWLKSSDFIEKEGELLSLETKGSSHKLFDIVQEFRKILIDLGFREVAVPTLIDKDEIYKQYGPQAPVILDRIFFLADLERPDIGIGDKKLEKIREIVKNFDSVGELQSIFKRYKIGKIGSDDLPEVLVDELGIEEDQATAILSLFEEFRELEPIPSGLTLRSHTTAGWFSVLQQVQQREDLPIQLFSVGPKYRREQKADETHLYESWTASLVAMAEEMTLEDGKKITKDIMRKLGVPDVELKTKRATSKYYAPQTEFEVFIQHPETGEMIEIGDAGFYSPVALAKYEISNLVFNLGIGLERVLMVREGVEDIRSLVYPYQYQKIELSDEEIAKTLEFSEEPKTNEGKEVAEKIIKTAAAHREEPSPCEFSAFEGEILGAKVKVSVVEPEKGTKLIGPAGFNEIFVYEGNIVGIPREGWEEKFFEARKKGVSTGITYMDAFAALAASKIEDAIKRGQKEVIIRAPIVKSLGSLNLKLGKQARRYITNNKKLIDIRGPFFTTVAAEIK